MENKAAITYFWELWNYVFFDAVYVIYSFFSASITGLSVHNSWILLQPYRDRLKRFSNQECDIVCTLLIKKSNKYTNSCVKFII